MWTVRYITYFNVFCMLLSFLEFDCLDVQTYSPCYYFKEFIDAIKENLNVDCQA